MRSIERRALMPAGCQIDHGYHGDYCGTTDEVVRRLPVTAAHNNSRLLADKHLLADGRPGLTRYTLGRIPKEPGAKYSRASGEVASPFSGYSCGVQRDGVIAFCSAVREKVV